MFHRSFAHRSDRPGTGGSPLRLGKKLVLAAACVLGLSSGVGATVLSTPVLLVSSNTFMSCLISNVSDRDTTVRIEVLGFYGNVLADSDEITLKAGESDGQSAYETARCRFTVANKNAVRAHGSVNHGGIGSTSSVEAK